MTGIIKKVYKTREEYFPFSSFVYRRPKENNITSHKKELWMRTPVFTLYMATPAVASSRLLLFALFSCRNKKGVFHNLEPAEPKKKRKKN